MVRRDARSLAVLASGLGKGCDGVEGGGLEREGKGGRRKEGVVIRGENYS